jgi:hypothetical protein
MGVMASVLLSASDYSSAQFTLEGRLRHRGWNQVTWCRK